MFYKLVLITIGFKPHLLGGVFFVILTLILLI